MKEPSAAKVVSHFVLVRLHGGCCSCTAEVLAAGALWTTFGPMTEACTHLAGTSSQSRAGMRWRLGSLSVSTGTMSKYLSGRRPAKSACANTCCCATCNQNCPLPSHQLIVIAPAASQAMVLSFHSKLRHKEDCNGHILMSCCGLECAVPGLTLNEIFRVIVWSLNAASRNRHPEVSHDGSPWPPGSWRAEVAGTPIAEASLQMVSFEGDWKFAWG